jgi:hypothetical protein
VVPVLTSAGVELAKDLKATADALTVKPAVSSADHKAIFTLGERADELGMGHLATAIFDSTHGGNHDVERVQLALWEAALAILAPAAA